jgi:histidinol-phosphate/aromatic aminotransferase/cobyric acid decarboxylase-like protein
MKNDSLVKVRFPLGKGDAWIEVTSSHFAFVDFRAHPDGIECLRVSTGTSYEKQRAIDALRSVADFLESKLDAAEVSPCAPLPSS